MEWPGCCYCCCCCSDGVADVCLSLNVPRLWPYNNLYLGVFWCVEAPRGSVKASSIPFLPVKCVSVSGMDGLVFFIDPFIYFFISVLFLVFLFLFYFFFFCHKGDSSVKKVTKCCSPLKKKKSTEIIHYKFSVLFGFVLLKTSYSSLSRWRRLSKGLCRSFSILSIIECLNYSLFCVRQTQTVFWYQHS